VQQPVRTRKYDRLRVKVEKVAGSFRFVGTDAHVKWLLKQLEQRKISTKPEDHWYGI